MIGMALLFVALSLRKARMHRCRRPARRCSRTSRCCSCRPVSVSSAPSRVADEWSALLAALIVSTFVSMAVTALVMKALVRKPAETGRGR